MQLNFAGLDILRSKFTPVNTVYAFTDVLVINLDQDMNKLDECEIVRLSFPMSGLQKVFVTFQSTLRYEFRQPLPTPPTAPDAT